MKFSYSTTNWIFFRFLIILPNLLIFDRQNIDKIRTQKSLLGIRLWGITFLQIERARCLPQINAIKFLGNPTGKIFQRQMKVALEVKFTPLLSRYAKVLNQQKCSLGQRMAKIPQISLQRNNTYYFRLICICFASFLLKWTR